MFSGKKQIGFAENKAPVFSTGQLGHEKPDENWTSQLFSGSNGELHYNLPRFSTSYCKRVLFVNTSFRQVVRERYESISWKWLSTDFPLMLCKLVV